jgi:hypothetical protein
MRNWSLGLGRFNTDYVKGLYAGIKGDFVKGLRGIIVVSVYPY